MGKGLAYVVLAHDFVHSFVDTSDFPVKNCLLVF